MAKLNREGPAIEGGPVQEWKADVDGTTLNFAHFHATVDATPLLKGLPNDECQTPHWGYVISGEISYTTGGIEEVFREGDAFYIGAGHTAGATAGAQVIQFSPTDSLRETEAVMRRNMEAMTR